jgi:hypothetical protein
MPTFYKKAGLIGAIVATAAVVCAMPVSLKHSNDIGRRAVC